MNNNIRPLEGHQNVVPGAQTQEEVRKLDKSVSASEDSLVSVSTVFPFELFPDKVIVDSTKVTIIKQSFFYVYHTESILIKDLVTVVVETSLFFAAVRFVDRFFADNPTSVHYLWKEDAERIRTVIHGLMVASDQNIEIKDVPSSTLVPKLEQIGSTGN